jgi:hypothetical protein
VFRCEHKGQHTILYFLERFHLGGGRTILLTVSFLEKVLAIRTERYQLQIDLSSRTAIPVEGIHHLTSQLHFRADLAVERGAHHYLGLRSGSLSLIASPFWSCYCTRFLLYCIYCFRSVDSEIYSIIFKTGFPQGGFIQGHRPKITVSTHAF